MREHVYRGLFGITLDMVFLLWTVMNVPKEGPSCGRRIHLMWILMFVKDYSNGKNLAGRCGICQKMYRGWVEQFIDHASKINLISLSLCWITDCLVHKFYELNMSLCHLD